MMDAMPVAPRAGDVIGRRYQLVELAGPGGMADVWRADVVGDLGFRRPIADRCPESPPKVSTEAGFVILRSPKNARFDPQVLSTAHR